MKKNASLCLLISQRFNKSSGHGFSVIVVVMIIMFNQMKFEFQVQVV